MSFRPFFSSLLLFLLCAAPASALDSSASSYAPSTSGSSGPSTISSQARSSVVIPSRAPSVSSSATLPSDRSSADFTPYMGAQITSQRMGENLCAITFDDGPSVYTPHLLDMLDAYEITATFFMLGKNVKLYPQHVQRIVAEGHEVGNHSFSHPNLRRISRDRKQEEIEITDKLLRDLGANPIYMRPPYGSYDKDVVDIAGRLGITVVLWSVDSQDWKRRPANYAQIINAVGRVFPPGEMRGILLFHDPLKTTAADLPKIISDLKAGGCQRFVTVSEYINSVLDPEPPLLWTERSPAHTPPSAVAAEQESEALMPPESYASAQRSWPAGSAPMPLARSSRPWPEEAAPVSPPPLMPSRVASHAPESLYAR